MSTRRRPFPNISSTIASVNEKPQGGGQKKKLYPCKGMNAGERRENDSER